MDIRAYFFTLTLTIFAEAVERLKKMKVWN